MRAGQVSSQRRRVRGEVDALQEGQQASVGDREGTACEITCLAPRREDGVSFAQQLIQRSGLRRLWQRIAQADELSR